MNLLESVGKIWFFKEDHLMIDHAVRLITTIEKSKAFKA